MTSRLRPNVAILFSIFMVLSPGAMGSEIPVDSEPTVPLAERCQAALSGFPRLGRALLILRLRAALKRSLQRSDSAGLDVARRNYNLLTLVDVASIPTKLRNPEDRKTVIQAHDLQDLLPPSAYVIWHKFVVRRTFYYPSVGFEYVDASALNRADLIGRLVRAKRPNFDADRTLWMFLLDVDRALFTAHGKQTFKAGSVVVLANGLVVDSVDQSVIRWGEAI